MLTPQTSPASQSGGRRTGATACVLGMSLAALAALAAEEQPLGAAPGRAVPPALRDSATRQAGGPRSSGGDSVLSWNVDRRLSDVRGAFAHPLVPGLWAVACARGVSVTWDSGGEWRPLAGSAEKLGEVAWIAFPPDGSETLYIATASRGLWAARIPGPGAEPSLDCIGSRKAGMASDSCAAVYVSPHDPRWKALLVAHGEAAPGISRTDDLGRTWRVTARSFFASRLLFPPGDNVFMAASRAEGPGRPAPVSGIWTAPGLGEYWSEVLGDVLVTDAASSLREAGVSYWATSDSGLWRLASSWSAVTPERLPVPLARGFWSAGVVCGEGPGSELLYAYDPRSLGLLFSTDGMKTALSANRGLYVGPYVKDPARVVADASGRRFLAVVNGLLHVGRPVRGGIEVRISETVLTYAANTYSRSIATLREETRAVARRERGKSRERPGQPSEAGRGYRLKDLVDSSREIVLAAKRAASAVPLRELRIAARVPAGEPRPTSVTVDLRPLGGPAECPMLAKSPSGPGGDSGAGGEPPGALYETSFRVRPSALVPDPWNRDRDVRGRLELWATASWPDRRQAAQAGPSRNPTSVERAAAALLVERLPEGFVFWSEGPLGVEEARGDVSASVEAEEPVAPAGGGARVRISSRGGDWRVVFGKPRGRFEVSTLGALSFRVRRDASPDSELFVHLRDDPEHCFPTLTPGVPILREGFAESAARDGYLTVVVPVQRLLRDSGGFLANLTACVGFSGSLGPAEWCIREIRFLSDDELGDWRHIPGVARWTSASSPSGASEDQRP